jgi:hypothetical protein
MSKSFFFLSAALLVGIAPKLEAQAAGSEARVAIPPAAVARMVAVKKPTTKGTTLRKPSASQRAPDPSTLVVEIGPNGERRLARPKPRVK